MKACTSVRTFLMRAVGLGVCAACALAVAPRASAADGALLSIDSAAPLHATLLPTVSITSSASHPERVAMRVAPTAPLDVVLLPTVHVYAHELEALGATDESVDERPEYASYATDTSRRLACFEDGLPAATSALHMDPMSR